ncbi:MAG TPA: DHHA1 domain-containing protein, partial [Thomasclavelia ramosa]|nr:DHHA1 domain-containing protein [Thomasclavelia ramosa]
EINGVKVLFVEEMIDAAKAKQLAFDFRDKIEEGIVILVTQFEDKCSYFVGVTKNYVATGYKAGDIIKKINAVVDGRGGGKPDFAQGGCPINDKISNIKGELKNFF